MKGLQQKETKYNHEKQWQIHMVICIHTQNSDTRDPER